MVVGAKEAHCGLTTEGLRLLIPGTVCLLQGSWSFTPSSFTVVGGSNEGCY